jgi:hypothetical protein
MKTCLCDFCKLYRRIKRTINSGSHPKKNKLIRDLADLCWSTDEDLNYEHAINDGSWPTAVEVLEQRLERAKKFRAEHPDWYDWAKEGSPLSGQP